MAHKASFDLGFMPMPPTRLGLAYPPHYVFDTLAITRRLYPTWSSHSLEYVATRLKVANGSEHRALSDAWMVKDVFLAVLTNKPTVKTIAGVMRVSQPLSFADTPVCATDPLAGFEALAMALTERCALTIIYVRGLQRRGPRTISPGLVLEVHGVAYVIAHCHLSCAERTFRLDRIRGRWFA
jgi:DNA polymerase III epsilon subunit-like protein